MVFNSGWLFFQSLIVPLLTMSFILSASTTYKAPLSTVVKSLLNCSIVKSLLKCGWKKYTFNCSALYSSLSIVKHKQCYFCHTSGIMDSLYSRIHNHLWAAAQHRKIELMSTLEKQLAVGERKDHVLGFQVMPL